MEQYLPMRHRKYFFIIFLLFLFSAVQPGWSEQISLKFSFKTNNIADDDLNAWINSYNNLWRDWQDAQGGELTGAYVPLSYGPGFEVEVRIPIFKGLALDFGGGTKFSDAQEGTITLENSATTQIETQYIKNQISAIPFKIGFSYSLALPMLPRLHFFAAGGRQITLIKYSTWNDYTYDRTISGIEYAYWFKKENVYNSESLGYYASLGIEFDIIKYIAVVAEAEKTWAKTDGFKGSNSYSGFLGTTEFNRGGNVSLYYYEDDPLNLGYNYPILEGHKNRPEEGVYENLRQGILDFSNFSFKIGIRFKF